MVRNVAEEAQGRGIGADDIFNSIEQNLAKNSEIIQLGRVNGELRYTTKEMLELESSMLERVKQSKSKDAVTVSEKSLEKAFNSRDGISDEQKDAVKHITQKTGSIQAVSGMAGTGKSFMLGAVKEAYEIEGCLLYTSPSPRD